MAIVPVGFRNPPPPEVNVVLRVRVTIRVHDAAHDFLVREAGGVDGGDEREVGEGGRHIHLSNKVLQDVGDQPCR